MKLEGDRLGPEHMVFVDGKRVQAPIKELDTTEGWVDIFMPILPEKIEQKLEEILTEAELNDQTEASLSEEVDIPILDYAIERLTGKVKVGVLK